MSDETMSVFARRGADRLAAAVARLIKIGHLDARSEAGDALLDYMKIGGLDGPKDVAEWIAKYELRKRGDA